MLQGAGRKISFGVSRMWVDREQAFLVDFCVFDLLQGELNLHL